jgi:hypothetical protein
MTVAEAKARLLALDEPGQPRGAGPSPSFLLPAAGAALLLGIVLARRRRSARVATIVALAANPAVRSAAAALAGTALKRFIPASAR